MIKEIPEAKSLRWICNQIPDNLGNSNEERMLKAIREYCKRGADKIEELAKNDASNVVKSFIDKVLTQAEKKYSANAYSKDFESGVMSMIFIIKDIAKEFPNS